MAKRKIRKKQLRKDQKSNLKIINLFLVFIISLIIITSFLLLEHNTKEKISNKIEKSIKAKSPNEDMEKLSKYFHRFETSKEYTQIYQEKTKKNDKQIVQKKEEIKKDDKQTIKEIKESKPMLAIVIDDVTAQYQINKILNLGYKTTMSIMPPTPSHPHSAKIATNLPFYIIHLPMEAKYFKREEKNTLHVVDSFEKIKKRIKQIRQWYPKAKFMNNHTGSKFTEDEQAMDKLFRAFKEYHFIFMDSRTARKSVAKKMAQKHNMPYIVRNVFLDNKKEFDYIQNQLKKTIKIANKNGYAIAICHPHKMTLKVLKESKYLFKGLDLVYLNQLSVAK